MKLNKVLTYKILSVLLLTMYVVSTFFNSVFADETIIDWDTYGVDIAQTGAYSYWYRYGLSNISYQEQQSTGYVITTTYGQHNFNITREGVLGNTYSTYYVYNINGVRLGEYHSSYHTTTSTGVQRNYITYINDSNNQAQCEKCYIGIETDENDIIRLTETSYNSTTSGNDTYVNRFQQVIPSLNGTYSHPTTYNSRFKGFAYPGKKYVISFANDISLNYITYNIELISDRDISALSVRQANQTNMLNWSLKTFEITNSGNTILPFDWYCPQLNNKNVVILPIYQGEIEQMTPELYQLAYSDKYIYETHDRELIEIMSNGNNQSISAENENQQTLDDTTDIIDNYNNLNNDIENDFNSNMNNIDTSFNLNNYSGFVNSIDWVRLQFNNITSYSHINVLLTYALMIGLALLIMSRVL